LIHRRYFLAEVVQSGWWALVDCFNPQKECYRLILVNAWDGLVLSDIIEGSPQLPRLSISRWSRLAKQLQKEIEWRWHIRAFILDIVQTAPEDTDIVLAELLFRPDPGHSIEDIEWIRAETLFRTCLSEHERVLLTRSYHWTDRGMTGGSPGWLHEVLDWVGRQAPFESTDGIRQVQQWNASPASYLLQLSSKKKTSLWLKIVNPAYSAEYRVTVSLTSIFPEYLPPITSSHAIWGAWLMEDGGPSMEKRELSEPMTVWSLSRRLAELQEASASQVQGLIESGCTHWNLERIYNGVAAALPLIAEGVDLMSCARPRRKRAIVSVLLVYPTRLFTMTCNSKISSGRLLAVDSSIGTRQGRAIHSSPLSSCVSRFLRTEWPPFPRGIAPGGRGVSLQKPFVPALR